MNGLLAIFTGRTMLAVLLLGFSSGMPALLIGKTLQARLTPTGIDLATLGFLGLISLPFTLKVLWAPFIDRYALPPGRRRGWLFATQAGLVVALAAMAFHRPDGELMLLVANAVLVALLSATQDVAMDAWRLEALAAEEYGAGAGTYILGYRLALLVTGGVAMVLADHVGWTATYLAMAAIQAVGLAATAIAPEKPSSGAPRSLDDAVWRPLADLVARLGVQRLVAVAGFIVLYRYGEFLAFAMATPFLKKGCGFSDSAIGYWQGGAGLAATIVGGLLGGAALVRLGAWRGLLVFGLVQGVSNLAYWHLAAHGGGQGTLAAVVIAENLCYGLATAAFVAWMMTLCSPRFAATQYALLTALMAFSRDVLASPAGWLAQHLGWPGFFMLAVGLSAPGLLLLPFLRPKATEA